MADSPAFIHGSLDDYGLSKSEFRVYCHLARRAGEGSAWPSVSTISKVCRLETKTVKRTLKDLVEYRLIGKQKRVGQTSVFKLLPIESWQPSPKGTPGSNHLAQKAPQGAKRPTTPPKRRPNHLAQKAPHEVTPLKLLQEGTPSNGSRFPDEVQFWNSHQQLPAVRAVGNDRIQKLKARRKDPFFADNFEAAVDRICKSDFCLGASDRGWKADFDWILQPGTVTKIIEGKYDNPELNRKPTRELTDEEILREAIS